MHASSYKEQFLQFLHFVFPDGLPGKDVGSIEVRISANKEFTFKFDAKDYEMVEKRKLRKRVDKINNLEECLTKEDLKFLKSLEISIDAQEST
jgi:hypothetical protein